VYLQVHQLGGWSVRLQVHRRNDGKIKQVWSMRSECIYVYWGSSERDQNDLRTYQMVYQIVLQLTVTEWHRKRHSPNGIMSDSWDNYQEMITEILQRPRLRSKDSKLWSNQSIIGSPVPNASTGMFTKRLAQMNDKPSYCRPAWRILKEDKYNYWRAPCQSHRL